MSQLFSAPISSGRRPIVALLAVLAMVGALLLVFGQPSSARADGGTASISGTVTDATTGQPVSDIVIYLNSQDGTYFDTALTGDDGTYTFSSMPAGSYTMQFQPNGGENYITQCWQNNPCDGNETAIDVADGQVLTGYDVAMVEGGTISGTVTDADGNPVANVNVSANSSTGGPGFAATDSDGNYTIDGLATGNYEIDFQPTEGNYIESWWNNQPTEATANLLSVTAGSTTSGINQQLQAGATISGTVSTADGPLAGAVVQAFDPTNPLDNEQPGITDANGNYTISGLPDGSNYDVQFSAPDGTQYANQWWNNVNTEVLATPVTTSTTSPATGIDATLVPGGTISGRIFEPGTPKVGLANATVGIYPASGGQQIIGVATDANGRYTITNVPAGSYSVGIVDYGVPGVVAQEWWGGTFIQTGAKTLTVASGQTVTGINQQLIAGSPISGTVTENGAPAANVEVDIWNSDQIVGQNDQPPFDAITDANGNYTLPNMGPGKYTIDFLSNDNTWASQWWNDKPSQARANKLTVTRDVAVTGVDANLAPVVIVPATPTITGRPRVGETLTAHPHNWKPKNIVFTYQWLSNGQPIDGATSSTYVPTQADLGAALSVAVTGTTIAYQEQGLSQTSVSAQTVPIRRALS